MRQGEAIMQLIDLLDKAEYRQIQILQIVLSQSQPTPISAIAKRLNTMRSTVRDDLVALQERINDECSESRIVLMNGQTPTVSFAHTEAISLSDVYWRYVRDSLKYQILLYLLSHDHIDAKKISTELNISNSTIIRRLREINQSLASFDLHLHNYQIVGS